MIKKLFSILAAASMLISVAIAADQEKSARADATFKSLDRNGDAGLTLAEVAGDKMLTEHFAMVDADRNGQLTKREYSEHLKDMKDKSSRKD